MLHRRDSVILSTVTRKFKVIYPCYKLFPFPATNFLFPCYTHNSTVCYMALLNVLMLKLVKIYQHNKIKQSLILPIISMFKNKLKLV